MMLENIEMLLEYRNLPISSIFDFLKNNSNFGQLKFINTLNNDFLLEKDYQEAVSKVLQNSGNTKNFDKEDLELLKGYFSVMGKTDLSGQISNCRLYKDFFNKKLQKLEADENTKCKSTGTFIIGAGILLIIVLI